MTSPAARVPTGRRSWLEPLLWLGIPSLMAILPWAVRQLKAYPPTRAGRQSITLHLTGDERRDRLALLEQAWTAARPRPLPFDVPASVQDRIARREAAWLAEICPEHCATPEMVAREASMIRSTPILLLG